MSTPNATLPKDTQVTPSELYGSTNGRRFDDLEIIKSGNLHFDEKHPITAIRLVFGDIIDGIGITYKRSDGDTFTIYHGSSWESKGTLHQEILLNDDESIRAISGKQGDYFGFTRVTRLTFTIYNEKTAETRVLGPFGAGQGKSFNAPISNKLVALSGYSVETGQIVGLAHGKGLFGLVLQMDNSEA